MSDAISLHFSFVSGPEKHKKCNEIAPIGVSDDFQQKDLETLLMLININ